MRNRIILLVAVAIGLPGLIGADGPLDERVGFLPSKVDQDWIDRLRRGADLKDDSSFTDLDAGPFPLTVQTLLYGVHEFLVVDSHYGNGGAYKHIGVYAPEEDGTFRLCLFARSLAAGSIRATVDLKSGMLEIRENANSELKGQIVLTCNLKTIGTYHSVFGD